MTIHTLLIEDSPVNLELMRYLLEAHGHHVTQAESGEAGLAAARQATPDLIVCDIQMQPVDGYEVARQLKQDPALARVPLIAVTALAMVGDRDKIMARGFDGYVSKPIDPETLVQELEAYLEPGADTGITPPVPAASEHIPARPAGGPLVLVVDNLAMNLELAESLLGGSGYRVATARSVTEALTQLVHITPDLLLSDVVMHESSGFDLLQAVRANPRWRRVAFVFITSSTSSTSLKQKAIDLGADDVIFRPIEPPDLLETLSRCLENTPPS